MRKLSLLIPGLDSAADRLPPRLTQLLRGATPSEAAAQWLPTSALPLARYWAEQQGLCDRYPERYWLIASPVHLRPDMDRLLLFPAAAIGAEPYDLDALIPVLQPYLQEEGLELFAMADRASCLLGMAEDPQLTTTDLYSAAGKNIDSLLPAGPNAPRWRQRMTEWQMLLHTAEHNQHREARAQVPINGLWLWGGMPAEGIRPHCDAIGGSAAWLAAFAAEHGIRYHASFDALLRDSGHLLWYENSVLEAGLRLDPAHRQSALDALDEGLIAVARQALADQVCEALSVHTANDRALRCKRPNLWQRWRLRR